MSIFYLRSNSVNPDPRVEKEVNSLLKLGYEVKILAWDRENQRRKNDFLHLANGSPFIKRYQGKAVYGGGMRTLFQLVLFQFFLLFNLFKNRKKIDIIHAADFDTVLPAVIMKFFFKKKVIYDIYDFYVDAFTVPRCLKQIIKRIDLWVIGFVDFVIITNETRIEQISGSSPKNLIVIHNTPDSEVDKVEIGKYKDEKYDITLSYVGILQNARLLEEILNVVSQYPQIKLLIAGFGVLESKVKRFSLEFDNIDFFGRVSYIEGLSISSSADYLFATYDPIVPNHKYSSPNKLYESMMLGKPIIVCKDTGIDSVVENENIGFVIEYSEFAFSENLKKLIRISKNEDFENNLKKCYETKYSWKIMESRLYYIYEACK